MKLVVRVTLLGVITLVSFAIGLGQGQRTTPLTNSSVTKLVRAGFKDKTIVAIIHSRPNVFQLEPERLIELKRSGVSENVILAMLSTGGVAVTDEGWDDDTFFGSERMKNGPQPGGTDIFGSGGESQSELRGRGMSGSGSGSTLTTGTATVRILRPPAEAGSQLKLEKTPTLTNQTIIDLVAAGFSEGTIIKRIETSPAEFDLTPAKLEELRKNRVSEPIIAAMTEAMSDSAKL